MLLDERTIRIEVGPAISDELALRVAERFGLLLAIAAAFIEGELIAFAPGAAPVSVVAE